MKPTFTLIAMLLSEATALEDIYPSRPGGAINAVVMDPRTMKEDSVSLRGSESTARASNSDDGGGGDGSDVDPQCGKVGEACPSSCSGGQSGCGCCEPCVCGVLSQMCSFPMEGESMSESRYN